MSSPTPYVVAFYILVTLFLLVVSPPAHGFTFS